MARAIRRCHHQARIDFIPPIPTRYLARGDISDPVIVDDLYSNSTDQYRCHGGSQVWRDLRLQLAAGGFGLA